MITQRKEAARRRRRRRRRRKGGRRRAEEAIQACARSIYVFDLSMDSTAGRLAVAWGQPACLASIGGASFPLVVLYLKLTSLLIRLLGDRGFEEMRNT